MANAMNVSGLFPQVNPLSVVMGGDTPKTRRLIWMKTVYRHYKCREPGCTRRAHYLALRTRKNWCKHHLPEEDRKRLSAEWQWRSIILPIARHVEQFSRR